MSYALAFLLLLVPLVLIHEFGHFIMAKLGGIHVTKFAFGFGQKLFSFDYKGTEYRWNLLPFGGYVDFMGESLYTGEIPKDAEHFYNRPKWIRFLVLLMGPLFNLILAILIFWAFFGLNPFPSPVFHGDAYTIGYVAPDSPEAESGLASGDRIEAINGQVIDNHRQAFDILVLQPNQEVTLRIVRDGETREIRYTVDQDKIEGLGVMNFSPSQRVMIGQVLEGKPAALAGLQSQDVITHINEQPIPDFAQGSDGLSKMIQEEGAKGPLNLIIERQGQVMNVTVTPEQVEDRYQIGISYGGEYKDVNLSIGGALDRAWDEFLTSSTLVYSAVRKLIVGELSIKTMSGPVGVGRVAKQSMDYGFWTFLFLMGILSLQLGILNLLPIPVLDGGEIFVLLVEWVSRKDFTLMTKMKIKWVGLVFLIGLMGIILVNDVIKIIQSMGVTPG